MRTPSGTGHQGPGKRLADASQPPWKTDARWKRIKTRHGRAIKFIQEYCRPGKGVGHGKTLKLAKFQKEFLEAALAGDVDAAVLQTPRGNGKSSLGGALACWALFDDDDTGSPQVPIVATTISQAIKSCYGVAVSMVNREPHMLNRALLYSGMGTTRIAVPYNEGECFPISNDTDGLQGLDPSLALVDEIGFQPVESWDSVRMASGKRERSTIIGVGTPGYDHDNALFRLRQLVHEGAELPRFVFIEHSAPEGCAVDDRKAWRVANPALGVFLRETALETDLALARGMEGPFRIFRLGQWYEGVDSWLGSDGRKTWGALTSPWDFLEGGQTWVGVDIGLKRDSSAVVAVQRREDGRLHAACRLWVPAQDRPVDTTDIMAYLRDLANRYDVQAISFDPRFFDVPAKYLEDEGLPMVEVPQSIERMTPAIGDLYELITNGQITHDGDEAFATHVLNAVPRFNERGFTLAKGKSRGRIDACIALALAIERAQRPTDPKEILIAWR